MTKFQEYLAHDMDDKLIAFCEKEAQKLERTDPWTQENTDRNAEYGYTCWLDLVLDVERMQLEHVRGQYCAEMGE